MRKDAKDVSHLKRERSSDGGEPNSKSAKLDDAVSNAVNAEMSIYHLAPGELSETQAETEAGSMQTAVILATAVVRLQYGTEISEPIRALMDAGGEVSLIAEQRVKQLKLKILPCYMPIKGVSGKIGVLKRMVQVWLRPWFDS